MFYIRTVAHFGDRLGIGWALSRLVAEGRLMRICQGVYTVPVQTRFGPRPPAIGKVISTLE